MLIQVLALIAVLATTALASYGTTSLIATRLTPRQARVSTRGARAAIRALPPEAGAATGYGYGFSPPFSKRALVVYLVVGFIFFPIWLTFMALYLPTAIVGTTEGLWVLRPRYPRLGVGRWVVVAHGGRVDASIVEERWKGAAVIEVADTRVWLWPGHADALLAS